MRMCEACERTTNQGGEAMDKPTFRDAAAVAVVAIIDRLFPTSSLD